MQFKCPNCGEAFALSVMVVPKTEAHGARRHKALADALDAMVLQAIADNPGRFMASGRHGLWENRFKLREELRVRAHRKAMEAERTYLATLARQNAATDIVIQDVYGDRGGW
mgnify:CR=1 FL=1